MSLNYFTCLSEDERRTAVLHGFYGGFAGPGDHEGSWLLEQLAAAANRAIHLNTAERELRARFPHMRPAYLVVAGLLRQSFTTNLCLSWTRDEDGQRVFVGATPPDPVLPRGQAWFLPGFDSDDYEANSKPRKLVPA